MKMKKYFPKDYNFFPKTYLLPSDYADLKSEMQKKRSKKQVLIVKPEASC